MVKVHFEFNYDIRKNLTKWFGQGQIIQCLTQRYIVTNKGHTVSNGKNTTLYEVRTTGEFHNRLL